jgi:hypothetical protein
MLFHPFGLLRIRGAKTALTLENPVSSEWTLEWTELVVGTNETETLEQDSTRKPSAFPHLPMDKGKFLCEITNCISLLVDKYTTKREVLEP